MPTRDVLALFWRDRDALAPGDQRQFDAAIEKFIADLQSASGFRKSLRVKAIQSARASSK
jgi:hypothetical protein